MKRVVRALDRHWFAPADLRVLAAVRIVLVGLMLSTMLFPGLLGSLGISGVYGFETQRWVLEFPDHSFVPIPTLKLLTAPFGDWGARPSALFIQVVLWLATASGFAALVGLASRTSMLCFAATTTLLTAHGYSYGELHHPQTLPTLALWALAVGPIGGAWAVDALRVRVRRARRELSWQPVRHLDRTDPLARLPIRTIQWLLVLAYLSAGLSKLDIGGLEWLNGYRILYHFAESAMTGSALAAFVGELPFSAATLALLSLMFELTFAVAVLVPRMTLPYVITGTFFHVGIYVLIRAPFVGWPLLYVVFIENLRRGRSAARRVQGAEQPNRLELAPAGTGKAATLRPPGPEHAPWTVYYDDQCPLCVRSMVILDALDVRRRLAYVGIGRIVPGVHDETATRERAGRTPSAREDLSPDALRHAMHVLDPRGGVHRGFFAFRALSRTLPPLWPVLPVLHLPGAAKVGSQVYARVARRRLRVTCRAGACRPDTRRSALGLPRPGPEAEAVPASTGRDTPPHATD